ncbi:MAG: hypothetical protein CMF81_00980, partial [Candidatus Marinimicrobia bacterium]|nr:hypothetical protein [Candidatus Neomarinimicrobiota bacterium]
MGNFYVIYFMRFYLRIFIFILIISNIIAQDPQTTLAVLDFEPRGINSLEAATLTDRFTSEIGKTETMILVDRTMVEEILKEQGFQQSGCTTDE